MFSFLAIDKFCNEYSSFNDVFQLIIQTDIQKEKEIDDTSSLSRMCMILYKSR
jgi:hypothetical protein